MYVELTREDSDCHNNCTANARYTATQFDRVPPFFQSEKQEVLKFRVKRFDSRNRFDLFQPESVFAGALALECFRQNAGETRECEAPRARKDF